MNEFRWLSDEDIQKSIKDLITQGSALKDILYGKLLKQGVSQVKDAINDRFQTENFMDTINKDHSGVKEFLRNVNDFLKMWTEYSEQIQTQLKDIDLQQLDLGFKVFQYEYIKEFVYGNYDYASVMKFVDGLIQGIEMESMDSPEAIEQFKTHTISLAFGNQADSVMGLLDSVLTANNATNMKPADQMDVTLFNNVKHYNYLFKRSDRVELYRAIDGTIKFILDNEVIKEEVNHQNAKLFIAFLTSSVEYMIYSMTAYATRIYVIGQYVASFNSESKRINPAVGGEPGPTSVMESAGQMYNGPDNFTPEQFSEYINGHTSTTFQTADEITFKDHTKLDAFLKLFETFLGNIGATIPEKYQQDVEKNNKMMSSLKENNLLFELICGHKISPGNTMEFHQALKSAMFNPHHGLGGTVTPKHEFLKVIRETSYGTSSNDLKTHATALFEFARCTMGKLSNAIKSVISQKDCSYSRDNQGLMENKTMGESLTFLGSLYSELAWAFAQQTRYIEQSINEANLKSNDEVFQMVALKIPAFRSDINKNDAMNMSIPVTTRGLDKDIDLNELYLFEQYEMFDRYLRSLPEFGDEWYLSEAGVSTFANTIKAGFEALWNMVVNFFNGQHFQRARQWVLDNEEGINQLINNASAFNNKSIKALPYKDVITIQDDVVNNLKKLGNFNPSEHLNDVDAFITSLYPSADVQGWFDGGNGPVKWKNHILFQDLAAQPSTQEPSEIPISGADLHKKFGIWVNAVKEAPNIFKGLTDAHNGIRAASKQLIERINQAKPKEATPDDASAAKGESVMYETTPPPTQTPSPAPEGGPAPETNTTETEGQQGDAGGDKKSPDLQNVARRADLAIRNIWFPLPKFYVQAIRHSYIYLKNTFNEVKPSIDVPVDTAGQPKQGQQSST